MASKTKKGETVSIKTIKTWDFSSDFIIEEDEDGHNVASIQCKICCDNIVAIRQEAKRRGLGPTILKGIVNYVDGVSYIHKTNVSRHVQSGSLHDWAKKTFAHPDPSKPPNSAQTSTTPTVATSKPIPPSASKTQNLSSMFENTNSTLYTNHFNTALAVVMKEGSMTEYPQLIELQKKNGVKFVSSKDSDKSCAEFVTYIAAAVKEDVTNILGNCNFCSVQQDGTEARKTKDEKEMVFAKVVIKGKPVEVFLKCQAMKEFGGVGADCLKESVDAAFNDYDMNGDEYKYKVVSACADGASVNMGKISGALTQMKKERPWLLVIHCSAHRIELAVKDAFRDLSYFQKVDDMMLNLHLFFRNSGKCWRILLVLAERLGVLLVTIPKSAGTRFQVHKYRAIKSLIINFLPLCMFAENMIESTDKSVKPEQKARIRGYLNQWTDYGYLASMHLYRLTLKETAHLSHVAQNASPLVTTLISAITNTVETLESLQTDSEEIDDLPFPCSDVSEDGSVTITAEATNLPINLRFKEANKMSDEQKKKAEKYITNVKETFVLKNVKKGKETVKKIKQELIPGIASHINKRLESFQDEIFGAFAIADHTQWDTTAPDYGRDQIKLIYEQFGESLDFHKFSLDQALYEWRELKRLVTSKFRHFSSSIALWQQIFIHHHQQFAHILLVIELILSVAYSSATVERGISTLNRQLTSVRTSMKNNTLNDLLLIRINVPILKTCDCYYETKVIDKAVQKYRDAKKRRDVPKKRVSTTSVADLHSSVSEDTFLPTPSSKLIKPRQNALLMDEEFELTDNDSVHNSDSETDDDDNDE